MIQIAPKQQRLSPLLKYPGGKEKELEYILPNIPVDAENYYEPFVGGGAVYFALEAENYYINDKSSELMELYGLVRRQDRDFLLYVNKLDRHWRVMSGIVVRNAGEITDIYKRYRDGKTKKKVMFDEITAFVLQHVEQFNRLLSPEFNAGIHQFVFEIINSVENKMLRLTELEKRLGELTEEDLMQNLESAFKAASYTHFRYLYNNAEKLQIGTSCRIALFFFIREYCYSSMFRYNAEGEFNVPYGGISYNRKSLAKKAEYFLDSRLHSHLEKTVMECTDFRDFLAKHPPKEKDFLFLDPPYDTEFSTYAQNAFGREDQERLADYLKNECGCYFMLVIKNTDLILQLYGEGEQVQNGRNIHIRKFDKTYFVSFRNRNNRQAEHLLITNY